MNRTTDEANPRVEAGLPFVEALARRMAATMPHSIDLSDLVQDGVIGLIDAAHRFDDSRGIKFETFAERRIRGAMIDALRKDAWPRGVRRVRRELEAAREKLRASLGHEPSLADLAQEIGSDEKRLGKTIVRINTIESTSPFSSAENVDESQLPAVMVPAEPERPDHAVRARRSERPRPQRDCDAAAARAARDRALLLQRSDDEGHRRGAGRQRIARLAAACARDPATARSARRRGHADGRISGAARARLPRSRRSRGWRRPRCPRRRRTSRCAESDRVSTGRAEARRRWSLVEQTDADQDNVSRAARSKSPSLKGLESQRQPVSSRKRSASVPATSPVTKITRRASAGVAAAIAR